MKRPGFLALLVLIVPSMLACGITNTVTDAVTGGDSFKPATELWGDVPRMDALAPGELEDLPLPVKLLMRTMIANLGRMNSEGEVQTPGTIDWISFKRAGSPEDVSSFYSAEAMAASGWSVEGDQACASGSATGLAESGAFCTYTKTEGGEDVLLAIIATQDDAANPTSVFFLRLEVPDTQ